MFSERLGGTVATLSHAGLFYTFACGTFNILLLSFGSEWEACQEGNKKILGFYLLPGQVTIV